MTLLVWCGFKAGAVVDAATSIVLGWKAALFLLGAFYWILIIDAVVGIGVAVAGLRRPVDDFPRPTLRLPLSAPCTGFAVFKGMLREPIEVYRDTRCGLCWSC